MTPQQADTAKINKKINTIFGANLRKARAAKEMSMQDVFEITKVSQSYISAAERGERNITLGMAERLANAVGSTLVKMLKE